jgi:hypothetical protein
MTVCANLASNMAVERPAGSHPLAAAAHCQRSATNANQSPDITRAQGRET